MVFVIYRGRGVEILVDVFGVKCVIDIVIGRGIKKTEDLETGVVEGSCAARIKMLC